MQKALVEMNLQLHNVISDITGMTGMRILRDIVAVVALARKLAGILYAMMRDETEFEDERWTTQGLRSVVSRPRSESSAGSQVSVRRARANSWSHLTTVA
jgi:hypothetical protein